MDPKTHFDHELGLIISQAVSSHLIRAHNKNRRKKPVVCQVDVDCECDPFVNDGEDIILCGTCEQEFCCCDDDFSLFSWEDIDLLTHLA